MKRSLMEYSILALAIYLAIFAPLRCSAACERLRAFKVESLSAPHPNAVCADGSPYKYFVDEPVSGNAKGILLWLDGGRLCENQNDCNSYCNEGDPLYDNFRCGSRQFDSLDLEPEGFLCGDETGIFRDYIRIFAPHCSFDWWMGNGITDPNSRNTTLFNGAVIFDSLLDTLSSRYSLGLQLDLVYLGGSGGGAVGAANLYNTIISKYDETDEVTLEAQVKVKLVLDSALWVSMKQYNVDDYYVTNAVFRYDHELDVNSSGWIANGQFDPECARAFPDKRLYFCLFLSNLLTQPLFQVNAFVIQSQYDASILRDFGLIVPNSSAVDSFDLVSRTLSYLDMFGRTVRDSSYQIAILLGKNRYPNFLQTYFIPACSEYYYASPTSLHLRTKELGNFGAFGVARAEFTGDEWKNVNIDGVTLQSALEVWMEQDSPIINSDPFYYVDYCGSFECNPSCRNLIVPFSVRAGSSQCEMYLVLTYIAASVSLSLLLTFAMGIWTISFRLRWRKYWRESENREQRIVVSFEDDSNQVESMQNPRISQQSIHIMVENLHYWALPNRRFGKPYHILKDVTLGFSVDRLHAIMGPSGSGKSTLLDLLSGNREKGYVYGTRYINGIPSHLPKTDFLRNWLRTKASYVQQSDILYPSLTVRGHLQHAAMLMLPGFMPDEEKFSRVAQVIEWFKLGKCVDNICGDGGVLIKGGLSGGERRRLSVATQILKLPVLLLLDEPTSGLDSTSALLLVQILRELSCKQKITSIMTLHQPRNEIFRLLDSISVIVKGCLVFSGSPDEAGKHFNISLSDANIGDSLLDELQKGGDIMAEEFRIKYLDGPLGRRMIENIRGSKNHVTNSMLKSLRSMVVLSSLAEGRWSWREASSKLTSTCVLFSRTLKRGGFDVHRTVPFSCVGGLLIGVVFLKPPTFASQTSLGFLAVSTMTFLQSTFLGDRYHKEKQIWSSEAQSGTKVSWASLMASLTLRNIVTCLLETLAFSIPLFFMGGLNYSARKFSNYLFIMILSSTGVLFQNTLVEVLCINHGGYLAKDTRIAIYINMLLLGMSALFNGFVIRLDALPIWCSWIPYAMVTFWGFLGITINNFTGSTPDCDSDSILTCLQESGDYWLRSLSYDDRNVFTCLVALLAFNACLIALCIICFYIRFVYRQSRLRQGIPKNIDEETKEEFRLAKLDACNESDEFDDEVIDPNFKSISQAKVERNLARYDVEKNQSKCRKFTDYIFSEEILTLLFVFDVASIWTSCWLRRGAHCSSVLTPTHSLSEYYLLFFNVGVYGLYVIHFLGQFLYNFITFRVRFTRKHSRALLWQIVRLCLLAGDGTTVGMLYVFGGCDLMFLVAVIVTIRLLRVLSVFAAWQNVSITHRLQYEHFSRLSRLNRFETSDFRLQQ